MSTIVEKKDVPTIEEETKIPFFAIIFGSLDVLILGLKLNKDISS
jgi:hypothetical protein